MFRKLTIAKPEGFNKTNLKILKIISIILAILILICLVLLVVGFIKKFTDISEHQEQEKLEKITTKAIENAKIKKNLFFILIINNYAFANILLLSFFAFGDNFVDLTLLR